MPNEEETEKTPIQETTAERLAIFDRVQYSFVNYAEVYWSESELRIAFADDLPVGPPQPKLGLVMTIDYARLLYLSLSEALAQWSRETGVPIEAAPGETNSSE